MQVSRPQALAAAALLVVAVLVYHALARPQATHAAAQPRSQMPSFLRFSGAGSVAVRPDRATINFTTSGRGASLSAATNQATVKMRRVLAAMRDHHIARINMSTGAVSGSRSHGAYRASQELTVTVMHVGQTGVLISAGITAGASANYGPGFSLGAQNSAQSHAIDSAVANARRKAAAAARAAGLHVTSVVSVSESDNSYEFGGYGPVYAAKAMAPAAALQIPIRKGSQRVTASVTVVFAYAPGVS